MGRHGGYDELGIAQRVRKVAGHAQPSREQDVRKIDGVGAPFGHVGDQRGIARPQTRIMTGARQMYGKRSSPSSGAEYRDLTNGILLENALADPALGAGEQPSEITAVAVHDDDGGNGGANCHRRGHVEGGGHHRKRHGGGHRSN